MLTWTRFTRTVAVFAFVMPQIGHATDVSALTAPLIPQLGSAYQADKQLFPGGACIKGTEVTGGPSASTFNFLNSLSQKEASRELGVEAGGRAQFGATTASVSAKFAQQSSSSSFSVSSIWLSEYQLPVAMLTNPQLSNVGNTVANSAGEWAKTCGDQFVSQITKGAKLFVSVRIDFSSSEQKQSFETKFNISGPLYSANASLAQASKEFSRDTKVTVSGIQIGGDVSKLTGIFAANSGGTDNFVSCTLGDFSKCAAVIGGMLQYASDLSNGFPAQLAPGVTPGGTPLIYRTVDYSSLGISDHSYPGLAQTVAIARQQLDQVFAIQMNQKLTLSRLIEFGVTGDKKKSVDAAGRITDGNLTKVLAASKVCYDTPPNCPSSVAGLKIDDIDPKSLELPDLPSAEFRLLTTHKGLWSRSDSIAAMSNAATKKLALPLGGTLTITNGPGSLELVGDGEASTVIYVQGAGIDRAKLMFEDRELAELPLSVSNGLSPAKVGPVTDSALIVVETTRKNPGWRDIDIRNQRVDLTLNGLPEADGTFYILVHDAFGRNTRFDIEYQKWGPGKFWFPIGGCITGTVTKQRLTRWWVSGTNGTNLQGPGPYSPDSSVSTGSTC